MSDSPAPSPLLPRSNPADNFRITIDEEAKVLTIQIPLDGGGVPSRSGYSTLIATTKGNRLIRGTSLRVGLNVYMEPSLEPLRVRLAHRPAPLEDGADPSGEVHPDHRPPSDAIEAVNGAGHRPTPQQRQRAQSKRYRDRWSPNAEI